MRGKCRFCLHLFLILSLIIVTTAVNLSPSYAQPTALHVDPPTIIDVTKTPGKTFTININVTEVAGLVSFAFKLKFNTAILDATAITKGAFFEGTPGPAPVGPVIELHKKINNDLGYVSYSLMFGTLSPYFNNGKSGSGILATMEFIVEEVGVTPLDLSDTDLIDPYGASMPHDVYDGYFSNTGYANPIAEFTFDPPSPILGKTVTFISGSYDIDGYIVSWDWDFGDGTTGNDEIMEHVYREAGTEIGINAVNVTLTVTDNATLKSTVTKAVPLSGHNLAVINVKPNQTYVMQNRTISISVTVKNKGSYSEHFNVTAYYNATPAAPLQTQLLAPKYDKTLTFFWNTSSVAAGTYTISANVTHWPELGDLDDVEFILDDNSLSADGTVTVVLTPVHDIAVIKVTATPNLVFVGDNVSINVTIANQGFTPETFNASIYYDTNLIEERTDITVPELTSQTLTFTWNTASVHWGTYSISANVSEVLNEINTANNNLTDGTVGVALHNINILSLSAPKSAVVGTKIEIEAVLKNEGKQSATFKVSFYYGDTWITNQTVEALAPSATKSLTFTWDTTSLATGPYTIKVKAAPLPGELVVTDNERTQLISLLPLMIHEITVVSVTASKSEVTAGESVIVTVIVKNEGNFSESFSVTAKYNDHTIETPANVTNLSKEQPETVTFTWNTTDVSPGTYKIKAIASTVPDEENTTNNIQEDGTVKVNEPPGGTPLYLIVAVGVTVIIVVAVVAYYLVKRKP